MSDLPYGPFGFPNVRAWGMAPPIAPRASGPQDLDPVEAAAMPITPDPPVRKRRPGVAAFEAVLADVGGDYDKAVQVFASELASSGIAPDRAMQAAMARAEQSKSLSRTPEIFYDSMEQQSGGGSPAPTQVPFGALPDADPRTTRAERLAQFPEWSAGVDRRKAEYDRATGMPQPSGLAENDGYRDWSGWQPGDQVPETPRMGPTALESARADQAASRLDGIEEKYGPQARMIAERGDAAGVTDYDAVKTPREMQKNSYRREQEMTARMQGAERGADGSFLSAARSDIRAQDERQATSNKDFRARVAAAPKSGNMPSEKERWDNYRAQMMLAGNNSGKNAVNAFNILTPEQQRDVVETRMKFGQRDGGKSDEWDRRLDMLRIQMENASTEREKDRADGREARQTQRDAEESRFAEERAARETAAAEQRQRFEAMMDKQGKDFMLQVEGLKNQGVEAAGRMEALRQQGENQAGQLGLATRKIDEEARVRNDAMQMADRKLREAAAVAQYGPGAAHILANNFSTTAAQESLRSMAAEADQTWNGFFTADAQRLDAILVSLGVTDPARRQQVVQEYGINSDIPGQQGRGSILSAWRVRHPDYMPVE